MSRAKPIPADAPKLEISMEPLAVGLEQAAQLTNIGICNMRVLSRKPGFPRINIGTKIIVPVSALQRWLEENIGSTLSVKEE